MIPKKPAPDLIRGGSRFAEKIMLNQKSGQYTNGQAYRSVASRNECAWKQLWPIRLYAAGGIAPIKQHARDGRSPAARPVTIGE